MKEPQHLPRAGHTETVLDAPPIVSNVPGSFAWKVFHHRHPALVKQIRNTFPYPLDRDRALDRLGQESSAGIIMPLGRHAADREVWDSWGRDYIGQRWIDVPFLWAESYFYRMLLDIIGFFDSGPWRGIDPFEPIKSAELDDASLDTELAGLDRVLSLPENERAAALLHASLWGNQADLGFRISTAPEAPADQASDLVADDTALLWSVLANRPGEICVVADNAGRELLADLLLIDHLLSGDPATRATLHVKPHPYYVSDATTTDLIACLRRLRQAPGQLAEVGRRLWRALHTGRIAVRAHAFFCAPWSYHHMPDDLAEQFRSPALTIMKGDLNYRRLVGDCHWPVTTSFAALTRYFPGPVAALRTLKSDVVTGLSEQTLSMLDSTGEQWRTNGTHALIQVRP